MRTVLSKVNWKLVATAAAGAALAESGIPKSVVDAVKALYDFVLG